MKAKVPFFSFPLFRLSNLVRFIPFVWVLLAACSQEKRTWTSLAWHNTLAHYNGYFIAREKMAEFQFNQEVAFKDNYNKVLDVYPFAPLGSGAAANAPMDEVIKKASIPIQRHKNSKWVDDCYQLIGQARFYKEDWENAIQTFKYINTKFTDQDSKHRAVIWLLITYVRMNDVSNAKSVIAYLKKEKLSKENLREGALAFAYYYQKQKQYEKMMDYLQMGVELTPRSKKKGRLLHALGQLKQKFGKDEEAYQAYKSVLKCWPSFELEFYTKTNMAQVVAITNEKQLKKIRKNFARMTTDLKYEEYLDKVYYEMGLFEVKQNNLKKGIDYLKISPRKGKGTQKPYAYMKLAELHYKPLRSYVWAKNYYDSCMLSLDTNDDNYKFVARRQKILGEFVEHYLTMKREDSLIKLSKMDTTQLYALIDKKIKEDKEKQAKAEKEAKKLAEAMASGGVDPLANSAFDNMGGGNRPGGGSGGPSGGGWYFGNVAAVAAGRMDFKKKWGNRKLEDNWRRSSKEAEFSDEQAPNDSTAQAKAGSDASKSDKTKRGANDEDEKPKEPTLQDLRLSYLQNIPRNDNQLAESHKRLQVALFEVGRIYEQKLEETDLAIETLERLANEYPNYEKTPEALYMLCLIYRKVNKPADFDRCKDKLLKQYPESVFAKLIVNPNYLLENKQRNELIAGLYRTVYEQYKSRQYIEASNGIASIRKQYPKSDYEDRLAILNALITAKTVDIPAYIRELKSFLVAYPKSDLKSFAEDCLKNAEKGSGPAAAMPGDSALASAAKPAKPVFKEDLNNRQYFLAFIPTLNIPEAQLLTAFSEFHQKFYPGESYTVTTLPFGDDKHVMLKVQELPSKIQAMYYLKKVKEDGPFKKEFKNLKPVFVLATQENMQLLYKSKALSDYVVFYTKNYDLSKELDDDIPTFGK